MPKFPAESKCFDVQPLYFFICPMVELTGGKRSFWDHNIIAAEPS
jgi:hypothetical protein